MGGEGGGVCELGYMRLREGRFGRNEEELEGGRERLDGNKRSRTKVETREGGTAAPGQQTGTKTRVRPVRTTRWHLRRRTFTRRSQSAEKRKWITVMFQMIHKLKTLHPC